MGRKNREWANSGCWLAESGIKSPRTQLLGNGDWAFILLGVVLWKSTMGQTGGFSERQGMESIEQGSECNEMPKGVLLGARP